MKNASAITSLYVAIIILITACKKQVITYSDATLVTPEQALVKINYASLYAQNPGVHIAINGTRVSNVITGRTPFPGGGYNTNGDARPDYLALAPGELNIAVAIPKRGTNIDSIPLFNTKITVEAGKNYTAHITDTAAKTQLVLATDEFSMPDTTFAKFKFVNLMPNVAAVDLYYGTTLVAGNVPYKGMSNYFTMKVPSTTLAWAIRPAGALPASTAIATYSSASTTTNQRVYTAFALGYSGATDAVRRPYISFLLNR